jgi:hypothetical protein
MPGSGLLIVTHISLIEMHVADGGLMEWVRRAPVLGLTHREVAIRYRGFESSQWGNRDWASNYPFLPETGLGDVSQFSQIRDILWRDFGSNSDLLYIGGLEAPAGLPDAFEFVGFDYGYYESVWGNYSILLNEVVYGLHPTMRQFGDLLNEHLLLADAVQTDRIGTCRTSLLAQGVDCLETGNDEWYAVGVWLYTEQSPRGS